MRPRVGRTVLRGGKQCLARSLTERDADRAVISARLAVPNEAAEEFGRLAAELRRIGRPMQQIAAIALTLGNCAVVTTDTDLSAIPGLRTENWAESSTA